MQRVAPNDLQQSILHLAAALPAASAALANHMDFLARAKDQLAARCATAGDVLLQVEAGLGRFLNTPRSSPFTG